MKNKKEIVRWTLIYLTLITGFIYLYVVDIDQIIYGISDEEIKSTIDFVYSQF